MVKTKKLCVVYDGVKVPDDDNLIDIKTYKKELNISGNIQILVNIANYTTAKDLKTLIHTPDVLVNKKNQKNVHLIQIGEFTKHTRELQDHLDIYIKYMKTTCKCQG